MTTDRSRATTYALDATPMLGDRTGIGRYVQALARGIAPLLRDDERLALCAGTARLNPLFGVSHEPLHRAARHARVTIRRSAVPLSWAHALWNRTGRPAGEWLTGPVATFHGTNFLVPPLRRGRAVVSVHDLAYLLLPHLTPDDLNRRFERSLRASIARSQRVVTDSRSTARNVTALLGVDPGRIEVIPLGVDAAFEQLGDPERDAAVAARHGIEPPYVLFVGTTNPRKNVARLVAAFARARERAGLPHRLAIVGAAGGGERDVALAATRDCVRVSYAAESDLPALYRAADAFAFPSLHEGFGLPVLEAMASATPVLTSDRGSLPEVAGNAALVVDADDVGELADGLERVLTDDTLRAALVERGRARAAAFSWDRCAAAHLALYRRLAGRSVGDGASAR